MVRLAVRSKTFDVAVTKAVVRVGHGRGFIIQDRLEMPPFRGKRVFLDRRLVITAAHCLPFFPPCHPASFPHERTYMSLLGTLDAPKVKVWAECLFADPIADIAVLGRPDPEACDGRGHPFGKQADAYDMLTEEAPALRIGAAPRRGRGWLLALDGQWVPCTVGLHGNGLWIDATLENEPGMSGSPILDDEGTAIGIVSIGAYSVSSDGVRKPDRSGPHPLLKHHLPGWLLRKAR